LDISNSIEEYGYVQAVGEQQRKRMEGLPRGPSPGAIRATFESPERRKCGIPRRLLFWRARPRAGLATSPS
jgi:hypothetical protein